VSYWEHANQGTKFVRTTYELDRMGMTAVWLPNKRPPRYATEFAVNSVNPLIQTLFNAEKARVYADSYRQFLVGAAAVAYFYGPQGTRMMELYSGANVKPIQGSDVINVHAEQMIMANIEASRRPNEDVYVPLLAVVGDLQPDQQSGLESLTLPPCGVCRDAFNQPDTPVDYRTLFVTTNPDFTTFEWFSLSALNKIFRGEYAKTGIALFPERSQILTPPDWENGVGMEVDTPEMDRAENIYEQKVMFPAINYVMEMITNHPSIAIDKLYQI
jgi:cytidine deaminase